MDWIIHYEPLLRLSCFAGVLLLMLTWEQLAPKRPRGEAGTLWRRRSHHVSLTALNTVLLRLLPGIAAVQAALIAEQQQWGLFYWLDMTPIWTLLLAVLFLDLAIYFQHRVFHAVPVLWRLHRLHHSDPDFDTTTALRFHPLEIALSMLIKFVVVWLLGAPVIAVIVFEVLLNAAALFNHGNVRLPRRIDAVLRLLIVTPDMHRVHHSTLPHETNSNFGFNFPWWDRLFRTYRAQPQAGHTAMHIGLQEFPRASTRRFVDLLLQPLAQVNADKPDTPSKIN
ncbi:MAG: sterol desaturase family protein [Oleiphilaceae bacterium]|nr:sterol desaturase family protein [Oleiphilaceae bacterium]